MGDGGLGASSGSDANAPSALSFRAAFDSTGTSNLADTLALGVSSDASTPIAITLRLEGQAATAMSWPSDEGAALAVSAGGSANVGMFAPFTDSTRAVAIGSSGPTYVAAPSDVAVGDIADDDAVLEVVFRAEPAQVIADKRGSGSGWALTTAAGAGGPLVLGLSDGQEVVDVASMRPMVQDAWYHCLLWLSHAAGARADCNGDEGSLTDIHTLGSLASMSSLAIGGTSTPSGAPLELAELSLFRVPAGTLGSPDTWLETSRRRFAALTGVLPDIALGSALPSPGPRASSAYVDLDRPAGTGRHLFLVGPDWPRIACRSDAEGSFCGYLSEPPRPLLVPPDASGWTVSELTVAANHALFADGEAHMAAVVPSTHVAPHVLSASAVVGTTQQVFSFYAKAESGHIFSVKASGQSAAIFDISTLSASSPAPVRATIEDWGQGLVRVAYIFDNAIAGPVTFEVHLLDSSPMGEPFAGDGQSPWVDLAGLQIEVSASYPGSLIGADPQAADQLVFVANDGNVPKGAPVALRLQVLLPAAPRLTDQAIVNLNLQENYANQVDLFVTGAATGPASMLELLGLQGGLGQWAIQDSTSVVDGNRHSILAEWNTHAASMWVDQMQTPATQALQAGGAPPSVDNMDVGFSVNSSGYLEGLVSGIEVGTP